MPGLRFFGTIIHPTTMKGINERSKSMGDKPGINKKTSYDFISKKSEHDAAFKELPTVIGL